MLINIYDKPYMRSGREARNADSVVRISNWSFGQSLNCGLVFRPIKLGFPLVDFEALYQSFMTSREVDVVFTQAVTPRFNTDDTSPYLVLARVRYNLENERGDNLSRAVLDGFTCSGSSGVTDSCTNLLIPGESPPGGRKYFYCTPGKVGVYEADLANTTWRRPGSPPDVQTPLLGWVEDHPKYSHRMLKRLVAVDHWYDLDWFRRRASIHLLKGAEQHFASRKHHFEPPINQHSSDNHVS